MTDRVTYEEKPKYGFTRKDIPNLFALSQIDKPYGYIKTLASTDLYCMKEIFMKKGYKSSMEYHVYKQESYYIKQGTLKIRFRLGQPNEYREILLKEGQTIDLPRGMMHSRISVEDVLILEVSTKDSNSDSHLVEQGGYIGETVSRFCESSGN